MKRCVFACIVCVVLWPGVSHGTMNAESADTLWAAHPHIGFLASSPRYGTSAGEEREYSLSATYRISGDMRGTGHESFSLGHVPGSTPLEHVLVYQGMPGQTRGLGTDETIPSGALEQAGEPVEEITDKIDRSGTTGMIYRCPGNRWLRGQGLVGGFYLSCMGILLLLPESVSKWEGDFWSEAGENLSQAWTEPPVWDSDHWYLNYIAHPYCGALAYNLMRSQGGGRFESFAFGVIQSCLYEYVVEAVAEQPSIQDLIVTPIAGAILGELIHYATVRMRADGRFSLTEKILVTIINPCWVVNNRYR